MMPPPQGPNQPPPFRPGMGPGYPMMPATGMNPPFPPQNMQQQTAPPPPQFFTPARPPVLSQGPPVPYQQPGQPTGYNQQQQQQQVPASQQQFAQVPPTQPQQYASQQGQFAQPIQQQQQQFQPYGAPPGSAQQQPQFLQAPPPGAGQMAPQYGQTPALGQPMQQQQQPVTPKSRLNPDALPSPVEVLAEDQKKWDTLQFKTRSDAMPPLALTEYVCVDEGNASPRFMRPTTYCFPTTAELCQQSNIPLGLVVQPFAELKADEGDIEMAKCTSSGPVRCVRCKGYINPNVIFTHGGQKFVCNLCDHVNDVPAEYFCALDSNGYRLDWSSRPELRCGIVDFEATPEFFTKPAVPATFLFILDGSFFSVSSGALSVACSAIKEMLQHFPYDDTDENGDDVTKCRIGIMVYDKVLHFYNLSAVLTFAQELVVTDIGDSFAPLDKGFFVNPVESETVISKLLDRLPSIYGSTALTAENCFGAAVNAAKQALLSTGGRMIVMNSALPSHGPGILRARDDPSIINTEKERQLYVPQETFFEKLAGECAQSGIGIDLFLMPNTYIDVATVGTLSSLTGGQTYIYPGFRAERDGIQFANDLQRLIIRPFGYDGLLRVRVGNGLRVTDQYGNFHSQNGRDIELATIDSEKTIGVLFQHDGTLDERKPVCFQVALLYTSSSGRRFIRCLNLSIVATSQVAMIYKKADMDTLMNIITKKAISQSVTIPLNEIREYFMENCVQTLASYRRHCTATNSLGQLILPESLKLFPMYTNTVYKARAFCSAPIPVDLRVYEMRLLKDMPLRTTMVYFYPRVFVLNALQDNECTYDPTLNRFVLPPLVRASFERLTPDGIYLLDNGMSLWLWVGRDASPSNVMDLFGIQDLSKVETHRINRIPPIENQFNNKVRALISYIQDESHKGAYPCLRIARQGIDDRVFLSLLVEDQSEFGSSFIDFMCILHKRIIAKLQDKS